MTRRKEKLLGCVVLQGGPVSEHHLLQKLNSDAFKPVSNSVNSTVDLDFAKTAWRQLGCTTTQTHKHADTHKHRHNREVIHLSV